MLTYVNSTTSTTTVLWSYRSDPSRLLPQRWRARFRHYESLPTFSSAIQNGLSSDAFDLSGNAASDDRAGLDPAALNEIRRIMDGRRMSFDEARLWRHQEHLRKNGIDVNGFPTDPKAVTSLS